MSTQQEELEQTQRRQHRNGQELADVIHQNWVDADDEDTARSLQAAMAANDELTGIRLPCARHRVTHLIGPRDLERLYAAMLGELADLWHEGPQPEPYDSSDEFLKAHCPLEFLSQADDGECYAEFIEGQMESRRNLPKERRCRRCGCTDRDCRQCIEYTGGPCSWTGDDICSACVSLTSNEPVLDTREWYRVGAWAACEDEGLVRASSSDSAADIVRDHNALAAEVRRLRDGREVEREMIRNAGTQILSLRADLAAADARADNAEAALRVLETRHSTLRAGLSFVQASPDGVTGKRMVDAEDILTLLEADRPATTAKHAAPPPVTCPDHKPVQHRDGKPPWCRACGLTADYEKPLSRLDRAGQELP